MKKESNKEPSKKLNKESNKKFNLNFDKYHALSEKEILKKLNSQEKGLTSDEAERRLHQYGLNELKAEHKISPFKIILEQFSSPLIWILLVALIISVFMQEITDAIVIALIVVLNAILGFVQEFRAEKAIEALQKMASLKAKVIRDEKETEIDSKYLVPGDIIFLETGDKVPADARLIEIHSLNTQEGPLTGESLPIVKELNILAEKTQLADRKNMVYNATIISKGRGKAIVTSTGMYTQVGKIATMISESHNKLTPLQKKLRELGKYLSIAVVLVAIVVFFVGLFSGESLSVMLLTSIALAVAVIPEGLPAVITISLALGVQRMIKHNALVRKLPSVETLGSVSVICTDKTGTLTHNQMTVTKIYSNDKVYEITGSGYLEKGTFIFNNKLANPEPLQVLLKSGMLCNDAKLMYKDKDRNVIGDPTEAALIVSAEKAGFKHDNLNKEYNRVDEIPFSSERKMMTTIHQTKKGKVSFTKGAPDIVIEKCTKILINGKVYRLDRQKKKKILEQNEKFANSALRVLGFAYNQNFDKKSNIENDMVFIGLQAMIDPPREEVKNSIKICKEAKIRVIMITGDHLATAKAIGKEIGIEGKAISGKDLHKINLSKEIEKISIFARVNPEDKLKIIKALKNNGYVVAMTGDGVNDAPALKKADIGISMGITGTDVAKEAADMILVDDNFTSIVSAVEEGRGIFDNIRKFVNYLLSSNLGEITTILLASIFRLPIPLTAIQILWVNLVTDGLPATALSVDPHQPGIMKRKPRPSKENILSKELKWDIIIFGLLIGLFTLAIFWLYLASGEAKARTMAFSSLVIFEVFRLYIIRSKYKLSIFSNKWLILAVVGSLALYLITIFIPSLRVVFNTTILGLADYVVLSIATILLIIFGKFFQWLVYKKKKNKKKK